MMDGDPPSISLVFRRPVPGFHHRMGLLEELASGEKVKHGTRRRNVVALFILFTLFAVPVWWKTTEIHRAPLPVSLEIPIRPRIISTVSLNKR